MTDLSCRFFAEPEIRFAHGQGLHDPRDGLLVFGPLDAGQPYGIRVGVVGTSAGLACYRSWTRRIRGPVSDEYTGLDHPAFPGFETVFRVPWAVDPVLTREVPLHELDAKLNIVDPHQRVYETVRLYADPIVDAQRTEDVAVDLWFVVIPELVHRFCRPKSRVDPATAVEPDYRMRPQEARKLLREPSLFPEHNKQAIPYHFDIDFHHQLKARLLPHTVPIQIVREGVLCPDGPFSLGEPRHSKRRLQGAVAWSLCTAAFYKAGGRPWKLDAIREGVCYVGLVFKRDEKQGARSACCAAQMFLDSGDGIVFRGAVGPWFSPKRQGRGEFHLRRDAARSLVGMAVDAYRDKVGCEPKELFIHGKTWFDDEEWDGFAQGVGSGTVLGGIRIRDEYDVRLYRPGDHPVLRGLALVRDTRSAYLWTRGYVPRLRTYVGREVPRPLRIDIARGNVDMHVVLADVLALTKLNYNTCIFSDGVPVTLRFADAVGEILTAGPVGSVSPLPFKYYI